MLEALCGRLEAEATAFYTILDHRYGPDPGRAVVREAHRWATNALASTRPETISLETWLPLWARLSQSDLQYLKRALGIEDPWKAFLGLRHTFGTDAARFAVTPWTLMTWLGHKRIDETMLYVNLAHAHARPVPPGVLEAGQGEADPDLRALKMLGARGKNVAKAEGVGEQHA
jgi:hypothetical protein